MNTKLTILLGSVGAVHLVAGGLFLAGGCAQEDPPMPPGIYVPQQDPAPAQPQQVVPAQEPVTEVTTVPAGQEVQPRPEKTEPKAQEPADSGRTDRLYVVVKNDSLWKIARKNGLTIEELATYNSLPANAKLKIGQKIYIPAAGKKAVRGKAPAKKSVAGKKSAVGKQSAVGKKSVKSDKRSSGPVKGKKSAAKPAPKAKNLPPDGIYVVKAGDNFSTIAKRHGLRASDIMAANPGVDSSRLKIGQKLRLTSDAAPVTSAPAKTRKPAAEKKQPAAAPAVDANAGQPAPSKEVDQSETDALLKSIPDTNAGSSDNAAVNAVMTDPNDPMAVVPDKDKVVTSPEGRTMEATVGEATTVNAFCRKYHVSESDIRKLNPSLPADGQVKAGTRIKLPGADDAI
ncbi:MAG: LysM peptidoglycan-binding domain-containing protein [Lentisphaeria bacterium]|nr:LysM peptidoglycan-binding domain-containing protein [Lentisphaeria bacterium]